MPYFIHTFDFVAVLVLPPFPLVEGFLASGVNRGGCGRLLADLALVLGAHDDVRETLFDSNL